jgi:hypothetical protein
LREMDARDSTCTGLELGSVAFGQGSRVQGLEFGV